MRHESVLIRLGTGNEMEMAKSLTTQSNIRHAEDAVVFAVSDLASLQKDRIQVRAFIDLQLAIAARM